MRFTPEQERAIHARAPRILVTAGAGSGKTSVLAERVLDRIREGIDVDRLVILTFTNAAAAEMRSRIREGIARMPDPARQLSRLDNAVIGTFDSFTLRIVRQNHHLLDLPADIGIADSCQLDRLQGSVLDDILADAYRAGEPAFVATVRRLFDKNDGLLRQAVAQLAKGAATIPDADVWLADYDRAHYGPDAVTGLLSRFHRLVADERDELVACAEEAARGLADDAHPTIVAAHAEYASYRAALAGAGYVELQAFVTTWKLPTLPSKSRDFDEERSRACRAAVAPFRDRVKRLRAWFESLHAATEVELADAWAETRPTVKTIVALVRAYRVRLEAAKRRENLFGFDDVATFALRLLEEYPAVRSRLAAAVVEVMIDEYQDTNDVQDRLVDLLGAQTVFMVGDVKQSIYGFRNANPRNFIARRAAIAQEGDGEVVGLRHNHRSHPDVIAAVNRLFSVCMDEAVGGVDYAAGEALIAGRAPVVQGDYRPQVVAYDPADREPVAVEADLIARLVASLLAEGKPVTVKTSDGLVARPCRPGDFCVLADRKGDFDLYARALMEAGIPVRAIQDEKFVAAAEIRFVLALLKLVRSTGDPAYAAMHFRHALFGAARSFVYRVDDDILVDLLADRTLIGLPATLPSELAPLARLVADLVRVKDTLPADAFLAALYDGSGVYRAAASLPDPRIVEQKLDHLLEKAATLGVAGFDGLFEYIAAIEEDGDLDVDFAPPLDLDVDAVLIMTMHKSKGLEFPFCIYPGLFRRFNRMDTRGFFLFDRRFGLVTKADDEGFKDTFVHALLRDAADRDLAAERIRLLYVALTRCREQCFLLHDASKDHVRPERRDGVLPTLFRRELSSFAELLEAVGVTDAWRVDLPVETAARTGATPAEPTSPAPRVVRFAFVPREIPTHRFAKGIAGPADLARQAAIRRGIRFHELLETVDFHHLDESLERLPATDRRPIAALASRPELRLATARATHHELEFIEGVGADAARGTIDLLILHEHEAIVVDYKLKSIDDPDYRAQLEGYRQYVKRVTGLPVRTYLYSLLDGRLVETGGTAHE